MADGEYSAMTTEDFDRLLVGHLVSMIKSDTPHGFVRRILAIGDVYCPLAEEFNNEVLEAWKQGQDDKTEAQPR